jgi:hypothetical protein
MGSFHISPTLLRATVLRLLQRAKSELVININTARFSDPCQQTYLPWNQVIEYRHCLLRCDA